MTADVKCYLSQNLLNDRMFMAYTGNTCFINAILYICTKMTNSHGHIQIAEDSFMNVTL